MLWGLVLMKILLKKSTCGCCEQCTRPIDFYANVGESEFQLYPNSRLVLVSNVFKKIIYCPTSGIIEDIKSTRIIAQEMLNRRSQYLLNTC